MPEDDAAAIDEWQAAVGARQCRRAFVTLLADHADAYVHGVLVWAHSMRATLAKLDADLVVMVTPDVSERVRGVLRAACVRVVRVARVPYPASFAPPPRALSDGDLGVLINGKARFAGSNVFTKLRAFALDDYELVALLDADQMFVADASAVFEYAARTLPVRDDARDDELDAWRASGRAVAAVTHDYTLASAYMAFRPSRRVAAHMLDTLARGALWSFDAADMGWLHAYYAAAYVEIPTELFSRRANTLHAPKHFMWSSLRGIDNAGTPKPWAADWLADDARYALTNRLWWRLYADALAAPLAIGDERAWRALPLTATLGARARHGLRQLVQAQQRRRRRDWRDSVALAARFDVDVGDDDDDEDATKQRVAAVLAWAYSARAHSTRPLSLVLIVTDDARQRLSHRVIDVLSAARLELEPSLARVVARFDRVSLHSVDELFVADPSVVFDEETRVTAHASVKWAESDAPAISKLPKTAFTTRTRTSGVAAWGSVRSILLDDEPKPWQARWYRAPSLLHRVTNHLWWRAYHAALNASMSAVEEDYRIQTNYNRMKLAIEGMMMSRKE